MGRNGGPIGELPMLTADSDTRVSRAATAKSEEAAR